MAVKRFCRSILLALLLLFPLFGCSSAIRTPHLFHPGPAGHQQRNAVQFDPYPQIDMGPEVVGGRPRGYLLPPEEVERARQFSEKERWQGRR